MFIGDSGDSDPRRRAIRAAHRCDETMAVAAAIDEARLAAAARRRIETRAGHLIGEARSRRRRAGGLDAFLQEYALSSEEGVVLMCLAEALLRIPDAATADRLIRDKLAGADWQRHLGQSESIFVNASTWGLMLTGRVIRLGNQPGDLGGLVARMTARSGEPLIRQALIQAMRIMARQFVMGRDIGEALKRAGEGDNRHYRYSFDMLGEAAQSAADAERYFAAYDGAIAVLGAAAGGAGPIEAPGISVKLSALHPRFELAQRPRMLAALVARLGALAARAAGLGIGLTVDAEEAARLEPTLDVVAAMLDDPALDGWDGFGLAVQAYQKRAGPVIDWLAESARAKGRRLMVRLVKGAYWDSEIKLAQEAGLETYPVYTRKMATDVAYIACTRRILAADDVIYGQFATHNAHTIATVLELAGPKRVFEFQRLHGMGEELYGPLIEDGTITGARGCRVYAPVGSHEDLLPYLVRRLLENGANTSFVNRLVDEESEISDLVADPVVRLAALSSKPHPQIPAPRDVLGGERLSARGIDLSDPAALDDLAAAMGESAGVDRQAGPLIAGRPATGAARAVLDPADRRRVAGHVVEATPEDCQAALAAAAGAAPAWDAAGADHRAAVLARAADLLEENMPALMALCVSEAGKTIADAVSEIREAVDFCRYYAQRARADFAQALTLPGPTGETNTLALHGRGVFACISPWNFPLAIFTGQIAAALAAGNAVIAKPAEQTPLIAAEAVRLLHRAGVPGAALNLLPGDGAAIGGRLVGDVRVCGIAFTGSTETARAINRGLAARPGPIVPLIAETGGQNAMIVDSSALAEQVVGDVITSAFLSAGQRCSALRVLFVQDDVADRIIDMICGAMAELAVGDPALVATDIGPVIDEAAREELARHAARMAAEGRLLYRCRAGEGTGQGCFFSPAAFEIDRLSRLEREVFGPILHVIRYPADRLDAVMEAIRRTGYGLTLGIHSRIDSFIRHIAEAMPVGNIYVNRSMIGAVVGVQPFGGEGLSGTGPKAGGPHYLHRFAVERTLSVNTVAMGGNASLLTLDDDADGPEISS
jgi:RHH-type transcriptional regulator, proline utilization regulon repressor / proline dehydrogenase / delta 1-pyrroline-5-carboxylate dehydrogenase